MSFHFLQSHIQPRRQICCKSSFISRTAVSFFQAVFKWFVSSITRQTKKAMSIFSLYFMLLLTPYSLGKHISSINQSMYIVARLASHKKAETCDRRRFPPTSALKNTLGYPEYFQISRDAFLAALNARQCSIILGQLESF